MGLGDWLRRLFGGKKPAPPAVVPFFDVPTGRVVRIPAAELGTGVIQARLHGVAEPVWVLPEQLQQSELLHPPFDEDTRNCIRAIQNAFSEHRPLSFDEWEEGFRRDAFPLREIRLWLHAANLYSRAANEEPSAARRRDMYRCIVACLTANRETVWRTLRPAVLPRAEAEELVRRFYEGCS